VGLGLVGSVLSIGIVEGDIGERVLDVCVLCGPLLTGRG
jgi:hypothetical protein